MSRLLGSTFLFLLLIFALPIGATAQQGGVPGMDAQAVQTTVQQFFACYERKDLPGYLSLWDEKSPGFAPHATAMKDRFDRASGQSPADSFHITQVRILGWLWLPYFKPNGASILPAVSAFLSVGFTQGGESRQMNRAVLLVKRRDGLKVWGYRSSADMVTQILLSCRFQAEREQFIYALAPITGKDIGLGVLNLAESDARSGDYRTSQALFAAAAQLLSQAGDSGGEAAALYFLGNLYYVHGEYLKAERPYRDALRVFRQLSVSDRKWDLDRYHAQYSVGAALAGQRHVADALPLLSNAATELKRLNDAAGTAAAEQELGEVYSKQQPRKAIAHFRAVCAVADRRQDLPASAAAWQRVGMAYLAVDKYREARQSLAPAAYHFAQLSDTGSAADDHRLMGDAFLAQGDLPDSSLQLEKAKRLYDTVALYESLDSVSVIANLNGLALTYTSLAQMHLANRRYSQAAAALRLALDLFRRTGNRYGAILAELGAEELESRSPERLGRDIRWALRATGAREDAPQISSNVQLILGVQAGQPLSIRGDLAASLRLHRRILAMSAGSLSWQAASNLNLATIHYERREFVASARAARVAENIAATAQSPEIGWRAFAKEGQAQTDLSNVSAAIACYRTAIALIEQQRYYVGGEEEQRRRYLKDNTWLYQQLITVLVARQKGSDLWDALDYSEKIKGRIVLDALLRSRSKSTYAALAEDPQPENMLSARQASSLLPDARTALLEFCLTNDRLFLFVLTRPGPRRSAALRAFTLKRVGLEQDVNSLYSAIGFVPDGAQPDPNYADPARLMYRRLLLRAQPLLTSRKNIVIVPDGALWNVPFPALVISLPAARIHYLIEDAAISYAYSLTWLWRLQQRRNQTPKPPLDFVAFGNIVADAPRSPFSRTLGSGSADPALLRLVTQQLKDAGRAYGGPDHSQVFCGPQVTQARYRENVGKARIVQVTCHGKYRPEAPMASYLRLTSASESGWVRATDMLKTPLSAEMMILAACETGRGQTPPGEGLIGMTWALARAGCRAALVSQWQIPFDSTGLLTHDMHAMLSGQCRREYPTQSKAEILQAAMLHLLRQHPRYAHPYFWAASMLVGDGGPLDRHWIVQARPKPILPRPIPKPADNVKLNALMEVSNPFGSSEGTSIEVSPGDIVNVKVFVGNSGTSLASNIRIRVLLPDGMVYVPQSTAFDSKEDNQNVEHKIPDTKVHIQKNSLTWAYFDLPPSPSTATYLYFGIRVAPGGTFRRKTAGDIQETLKIAASCSCLTHTVTTNSAAVTISRKARPEIHCVMWDGVANLSLRQPKKDFNFYEIEPATAAPGDTLWYEVLFANMGNTDLHNARVQVRLPPNTRFEGNVEQFVDMYGGRPRIIHIEGSDIVGHGLVLPCLRHGNTNGQLIRFRVSVSRSADFRAQVNRASSNCLLIAFEAALYAEPEYAEPEARIHWNDYLSVPAAAPMATDNANAIIYLDRGLHVFSEAKDPTYGLYKPNPDDYLQEGQAVDRRIFLQNNSLTTLRNVIVKVGMSAQLSYIPGSLAVDNATLSNPVEAGALGPGMKVTDMPPGFCQMITFRERVNSNPTAQDISLKPDIDVKTPTTVTIHNHGWSPKLIRQ